MALLQVSGVHKAFDGTPVLRGISFEAEEGDVVCLLGPSGCGKTTLLRIVAGLEIADRGQVVFDGRDVRDVPVHQRGFGLMFQDYALFPHKDVAANVAFGLRMQAVPRPRVLARVAEMLDLVGLAGYERRRVYELSGGEQQRVALARSLAAGPRLLMLDEPLGSLDRARREELMNELRAILRRVGLTALYVTHDQEEAFAVSDQVLVMRAGLIVQRGAPQEVYRHPASPWVARFLGLTNLVPGTVQAAGPPVEVDTPLGRLAVADAGGVPVAAGMEVTLLIRPEAAQANGRQAGPQVEGTVRRCSFRGSHSLLEVEHASGLALTFELPLPALTDRPGGTGGLPRRGERVTLALRSGGLSLLPAGDGQEDG